MGRRKEVISHGDHGTLVARVQWLWENRGMLPMDVEPAPAAQWYFADWLADGVVRRMSDAARGIHMDTICSSWTERPPCSWPAEEDDLDDLIGDLDQRDQRRFLKAWVRLGDRIWQPGLCKTYLVQMWTRLLKTKGAFKNQKNWQAVALLGAAQEILLGPEPFPWLEGQKRLPVGMVQDTSLHGQDTSLHGQDTSLHRQDTYSIRGALQSSPSPSDSPPDSDPGEGDPPLAPQGGRRTRSAKSSKRRRGRKIPDVDIPVELKAIGIDAEAFRERVVNMKTTKPGSAWQSELKRLAPLVAELGAGLVLELYQDAIDSGWQGCTPRMARERVGRSGPTRTKSAPAEAWPDLTESEIEERRRAPGGNPNFDPYGDLRKPRGDR